MKAIIAIFFFIVNGQYDWRFPIFFSWRTKRRARLYHAGAEAHCFRCGEFLSLGVRGELWNDLASPSLRNSQWRKQQHPYGARVRAFAARTCDPAAYGGSSQESRSMSAQTITARSSTMQPTQLTLCSSGVTGSSAASEGVCGRDKRNFSFLDSWRLRIKPRKYNANGKNKDRGENGEPDKVRHGTKFVRVSVRACRAVDGFKKLFLCEFLHGAIIAKTQQSSSTVGPSGRSCRRSTRAVSSQSR